MARPQTHPRNYEAGEEVWYVPSGAYQVNAIKYRAKVVSNSGGHVVLRVTDARWRKHREVDAKYTRVKPMEPHLPPTVHDFVSTAPKAPPRLALVHSPPVAQEPPAQVEETLPVPLVEPTTAPAVAAVAVPEPPKVEPAVSAPAKKSSALEDFSVLVELASRLRFDLEMECGELAEARASIAGKIKELEAQRDHLLAREAEIVLKLRALTALEG